MHKRYGFELIRNTPQEKIFKTSCACYSPDHDCEVQIIYDKRTRDLTMELLVNTTYVPYWWANGLKLHKKIWKRMKSAFKILVGKSLKYETSFIFRGRNHIEDFSDMILLLGKDCIKESDELYECKKKLRKYEENYK